MSTMPTNEGGDFTPPPEGNHLAVCYRVIDLGTQKTEYKGDIKRQHKVLISWELSQEKMEDGQPFSVHSRYTFSSHKKATLRKHLESWRGKAFEDSDFGPGGFDIKNLLSVPCLLSVVHNVSNGNTYANVNGVAGLPKGMDRPALENDPVYFWMANDGFDAGIYESLSEGLRSSIAKSPEYIEFTGGAPNGHDERPVPPDDGYAGGPDLDDDIPFGPETR